VKLTRIHISKAETCGRLLDELKIVFRASPDGPEPFDPLCLIGANGTGKSQLLQVIAEAFQVVFHACAPEQERLRGNDGLEFEIEYSIRPVPDGEPVMVRLSRRSEGKRRATLKIERKDGLEWVACAVDAQETRALLPARVIGYTSGDNETLSLPFLVSRSGYAEDVRESALSRNPADHVRSIPDTRLMLIDYATHIEVLVANLILGADSERAVLLEDAKLGELRAFRCIVQLAHHAVPKAPSHGSSIRKRKGVQLTKELENYLDQLKNCSTCYDYNEKTETYIFDFLVTDQTREAFRCFWDNAIELYSALHKLSMLNDLAIPKRSRERLRHDIKTRRFASRLPEPQDEDRVFRFEQVRFAPKVGDRDVDYVSLSDGEHQLAQILGTMFMVSDANVLFLLDEPESHFNPQWRVKFISRLMDLPTAQGRRCDAGSPPAQQDCLMTTHAPFVPSDMSREKILIFRRVDENANQGAQIRVQRPGIQTFGTAFDTILQECFDVQPPISVMSRVEIDRLMRSEDAEEIRAGIAHLGDSAEKVFLMDRRRQLLRQQDK
jgi:restriction system-associated AAA family ATPase